MFDGLEQVVEAEARAFAAGEGVAFEVNGGVAEEEVVARHGGVPSGRGELSGQHANPGDVGFEKRHRDGRICHEGCEAEDDAGGRGDAVVESAIGVEEEDVLRAIRLEAGPP